MKYKEKVKKILSKPKIRRQLVLMRLEEFENTLDLLNGRGGYWNENYLCIFCQAEEYNAKEGIVHSKDCLMRHLRREIAKLSEKEKDIRK